MEDCVVLCTPQVNPCFEGLWTRAIRLTAPWEVFDCPYRLEGRSSRASMGRLIIIHPYSTLGAKTIVMSHDTLKFARQRCEDERSDPAFSAYDFE